MLYLLICLLVFAYMVDVLNWLVCVDFVSFELACLWLWMVVFTYYFLCCLFVCSLFVCLNWFWVDHTPLFYFAYIGFLLFVLMFVYDWIDTCGWVRLHVGCFIMLVALCSVALLFFGLILWFLVWFLAFGVVSVFSYCLCYIACSAWVLCFMVCLIVLILLVTCLLCMCFVFFVFTLAWMLVLYLLHWFLCVICALGICFLWVLFYFWLVVYLYLYLIGGLCLVFALFEF